MAKLHEITARISEVTGLTVSAENDCLRVLVTGDAPEMIHVVREKLRLAGINFTQSKHRKFRGAFFSIPVRNVGTAFHTNWEFA